VQAQTWQHSGALGRVKGKVLLCCMVHVFCALDRACVCWDSDAGCVVGCCELFSEMKVEIPMLAEGAQRVMAC